MLTGWPDIDVRARALWAFSRERGLELRSRKDSPDRGASPLTPDAEVVGRSVERGQHPLDGVLSSVHHGLPFCRLAKLRELVLQVFILKCTSHFRCTQGRISESRGTMVHTFHSDEKQERLQEKLRDELGPLICGQLDQSSGIEDILVNEDCRIWVKRTGSAFEQIGELAGRQSRGAMMTLPRCRRRP